MSEKRPTLRDRIRADRLVRYLANGRYDQALADYDRAIELDATNTWAFLGRGETYRAMQRYDQALADYDRAIELDATNAGAIASRGETYRAMER
jgi:tetratricopeptide (TPR) repeat protein